MMKGRSIITFQKKVKSMLQGIDKQNENFELVSRVEWLRKIAGEHTVLGNKLIHIARRMKINARQGRDPEKWEQHCTLNHITMHAYNEKAKKLGNKTLLCDDKKKQIKLC